MPKRQQFAPRDWRRRPRDELASLIDEIRREAVVRHLSVAEWKQLDRMRRRLREQAAA